MENQKKESQVATENQGGNEEVQKPITLDDVNAAFTAREKRMAANFKKMLEETIAAAAEKFPQPVKEEPQQEESKDKENPLQKQFEALNKRLKAAEEATAKERQAREEERQRNLANEERGAIETALRGAGIQDEIQVRAARALLKEDGRIYRNSDGQIVMKAPDDKYNVEEERPLAEALKAWAKSEEGRKFQPPRHVQGSGATPPNGKKEGKPQKGAGAIALAQAMGFLPKE
jgi:hypothetical protein